MTTFATQYNKQTKQIILHSYRSVLEFAKFCGADIDINSCITSSHRYQIVLGDGSIHDAGGWTRAHLLFDKLNELFDLGIDIQKSGKMGHVFRIVFDDIPFNEEAIKAVAAKEESTEEVSVDEDQQQATEEDDQQGSSEEATDSQEVPTESTTDSITTEILAEEPEENVSEEPTETPDEPIWEDFKPLKFSKKRIQEIAKSMGIELSTQPKYAVMVGQFKDSYQDKYK